MKREVDLAPLTDDRTISAVTSGDSFLVSTGRPSGFYAFGTCTFLTGTNAGASTEVLGHVAQEGLGRLTKSVTFDVKTLEALRSDKGTDEGKVFNLVRGLQKEIDDDANAAPVLQPLKGRAERILKDLENRNVTGLAAMDLLAALAAEKDAASKAAKDTGLTPKAFGVFWALRDDPVLTEAGVNALDLAREVEKLLGRFPNARVNADEQRQLRASLYRPLIDLPREARAGMVDLITSTVLG